MVDEDKLSAVLSDFARTLITDFPIQGILDHLVERIVGVLPVTAAGVTLISDGVAPHYIAASDESAMRFERLQTEIGEGPCLAAYQSGQAIAVADLTIDARFPLFAPAAVAAGLGAVFTFPLSHGDGRLGALDLYRDTVGDLAPHDMAVAQTLADVAAAYLLNAQAREEASANSDRFHHSATHDALTGLPNRLLFQERLEHAAQRAKRSHSNAAVLFADLDRFKEVNDQHGHQIGDELLIAVARRLSSLVRSGDTVARFAGDEFVILFEELHNTVDADKLAQRIKDAFITTFPVAALDVTISASIGVAFAGPGQDISDELIVQADLAMYEVKRSGGASLQNIDVRRGLPDSWAIGFERRLRLALETDQLELAYQPIVRSTDGLVTGVEALLRWTDADQGPVSPLAMIGVAEQSGLINELGQWVLERACRDHRQWAKEQPLVALDLAVNVSACQLSHNGFVEAVAATLARHRMDPAAVIMEVTESVFIDEGVRVASALAELDGTGIRLAIDDFGTGYSSLSYLGRLPIRIVKIDQSFTAHLDDAPGRKIVAAVTDLAHDLGLTVVAEGVETASQRDQIQAIGCDSAQGYLFARPMPASAISASLAESSNGHANGNANGHANRNGNGLAKHLPEQRQLSWSPTMLV